MPTTEAAVRLVLETQLSSEEVNQFIDDAHLWVTEEMVAAGLSDAREELIERYLACALVRMRDLGLASAGIGDVREQYQVDPKITDYLQRAAAIDPTGLIRKRFIIGTVPVVFRVGERFSHPRSRRRA